MSLKSLKNVPKASNQIQSSNQNKSNVDIDQIIDIVLTDDRLLHYVNNLITRNIYSSSKFNKLERLHDLIQIIDSSIEKAIDQIQIVELILSLVQDYQKQTALPPSTLLSDLNGSASDDLATESKINEFYHDPSEKKKNINKDDPHSRKNQDSQFFRIAQEEDDNNDNNNNNSREAEVKIDNYRDAQHPHRVSLLSLSSDEEPHPNIMKRPQFSEKEPEQETQASVKRTVQQLNKHQKPPLPSHSYPFPAPHPKNNKENDKAYKATSSSVLSLKQQHHTRNLNLLDLNKQYNKDREQQQQNHHHHDNAQNSSGLSLQSAASSVHQPGPLSLAMEMMKGQNFSIGDSDRYSFVSDDDHSPRDSEASTVQITLPLDKSLQDKSLPRPNGGDNPLFDKDDSFHLLNNQQAQDQVDELHSGTTGNGYSDKLMSHSFQVTSEINSLQTSLDNPLQAISAPGKFRVPLSSETNNQGEEGVIMVETVKDWQKKISADLRKESISAEEEFFETEKLKSLGRRDERERSNNMSMEASVPPEEIEHNSSQEATRNYDNESFEQTENDEKRGNQIHPHRISSSIQPSTGDPSRTIGISFPSVQSYLSSDYDSSQSKHHSNIFFFDHDRVTDHSQGIVGNILNNSDTARIIQQQQQMNGREVQFVEEIIQGVYHYDRATSIEAKEMYYSHEELDRFDMHYRKEDAIAETMGLTWMEWKNQQPEDQEISFSDDEDDTEEYNNADRIDYKGRDYDEDEYEDDYNDESFQVD